jgi:hypothetical protein
MTSFARILQFGKSGHTIRKGVLDVLGGSRDIYMIASVRAAVRLGASGGKWILEFRSVWNDATSGSFGETYLTLHDGVLCILGGLGSRDSVGGGPSGVIGGQVRHGDWRGGVVWAGCTALGPVRLRC